MRCRTLHPATKLFGSYLRRRLLLILIRQTVLVTDEDCWPFFHHFNACSYISWLGCILSFFLFTYLETEDFWNISYIRPHADYDTLFFIVEMKCFFLFQGHFFLSNSRMDSLGLLLWVSVGLENMVRWLLVATCPFATPHGRQMRPAGRAEPGRNSETSQLVCCGPPTSKGHQTTRPPVYIYCEILE